ncbi:jg27331, partial [Pararge aegeria aegeria]
TQQKTEAARRDSSNPLSLLTKKFHHHEQPVILILGKDAVLKTDRSNVKKALSPEDSDGSGTVHQLHHLLGHDQ